MDCGITLDMVDEYLLSYCTSAEYCATHTVGDTTEYVIRIGDKFYVLVLPEKYRK
jgi:hypothetical protein